METTMHGLTANTIAKVMEFLAKPEHPMHAEAKRIAAAFIAATEAEQRESILAENPAYEYNND